MNGNVLREFLVGIGFQVDEAGFRKMVSYIERLTKNAALLAVGMYATAAAIGAAVSKIATEFESLFYLAQRAGSTVESITSLQYAFGQIGMSAADAAGAIESMGMSLRSNPGLAGLMQNLGVAVFDRTTGKMRDTAAITTEFIAKLATMPFYLAQQYAAMFGISARQLMQIRENLGTVAAAQREQQAFAKAAGVDLNDLGVKSVAFMNQLRTIWMQVGVIWDGVAGTIIEKMLPLMKTFSAFLTAHAKEIVDIGNSMAGIFGGYISDVNFLIGKMDDLVKSTIGWKNTLELVADVILIRLLGPLGWILVAVDRFRKSMDPNKLTDAELQDERQKQIDGGFLPGTKTPEPFRWWNPGSWFDRSPQPRRNPGDIRDELEGKGGLREPSSYSPGGGNPQLAPEIEAEVRRQATLQGVNAERAVALFRAEGGGYRNVSSAGAIGPGQLMPGTARDMGVDPWDWRDNVRGGIKYFAEQLKRFRGNYDSAEAAYNAGPGNRGVLSFDATGNRRFLPAETQQYLDNIDRNMRNNRGGGQQSAGITQNNTFNVTGADAKTIASNVESKIRSANADLVRWHSGAVLA